MSEKSKTICPVCGNACKLYDHVNRIVRFGSKKHEWCIINRYYCPVCKTVKRFLPEILYPYKQYERKIIDGFISGELNFYMIEYEDYPCEQTIKNWRNSDSIH